MAQCGRCGAYKANSGDVCPNCGGAAYPAPDRTRLTEPAPPLGVDPTASRMLTQRQKDKRFIIILAAAIVLVLAAIGVFAVLYMNGDDDAPADKTTSNSDSADQTIEKPIKTDHNDGTGEPEVIDDTQDNDEPDAPEVSAPVFSSYSHSSAILNGKDEYHSKRAFDGSLSTSWQENAEGLGLGEWLMCLAPQAQRVSSITIFNGNADNSEAYERNGRALRLRIEGEGLDILYDIIDEYGTPTVIELGTPILSSYIKFTVVDAVSGSFWQDVAIAEIIIS